MKAKIITTVLSAVMMIGVILTIGSVGGYEADTLTVGQTIRYFIIGLGIAWGSYQILKLGGFNCD